MTVMKTTIACFLLTLCLVSPAVLAEDDYQPGTTHFTVDVGFLHDFNDSDWALKGTVGIQSGFSAGFGSDIAFTRYPIDLLALYNVGNQHFGGGLTYHANPKLNGNGHVPDVTFKDPLGVVLEYQYRFIGFRYTNIRYKVNGPCTGKCSYDGSTLGFFFNFVF
jgi:hypothetical protein